MKMALAWKMSTKMFGYRQMSCGNNEKPCGILSSQTMKMGSMTTEMTRGAMKMALPQP